MPILDVADVQSHEVEPLTALPSERPELLSDGVPVIVT
jgi:hypothetical protein